MIHTTLTIMAQACLHQASSAMVSTSMVVMEISTAHLHVVAIHVACGIAVQPVHDVALGVQIGHQWVSSLNKYSTIYISISLYISQLPTKDKHIS